MIRASPNAAMSALAMLPLVRVLASPQAQGQVVKPFKLVGATTAGVLFTTNAATPPRTADPSWPLATRSMTSAIQQTSLI